MKLLYFVGFFFGMAAACPLAQSRTYESLLIDHSGQVVIKLSSGATIKPPKLRDQVSFSEPLMSKDHSTVAWLANYPDPADLQGTADPIADRLVIYRTGQVVRTFGTDQVFWSWWFADQDKDVTFCTGPTHGGASRCELHRIVSGSLRATWNTRAKGDPPPWAKGLSY